MTSPSANSLFTATPAGVSPGTTFAELYERFLVEPIFTPWASVLVDRAGVRAGDAALDVACGTGAVARLVRRRAGARAPLVGVDRNSEMLAVARRVDDSIDWREGDAAALPVREDERFDVVFCHQGLQFFPDKPAALGEMRRVLRPGGRVVLGVWRSLAENGLFGDLGRVAERFVGPIQDIRHSFADDEALAALLTAAGFGDVRVDRVTMETRFTSDPAVLTRLNAAAVLGMSAAKSRAEAEREELIAATVAASLEDVSRYSRDGGFVFPTSANVAIGRA